jgi:hypothetical protein
MQKYLLNQTQTILQNLKFKVAVGENSDNNCETEGFLVDIHKNIYELLEIIFCVEVHFHVDQLDFYKLIILN